MKAILLAAGVGKRMGPNAPPKCLLTVAGKSLLRLTLETLRAVGIFDVVLVVGYAKEQVMAEAKMHTGGMHLNFLENPRYREGAILSLWSAREQFTDDLLIMDADVLCPQACFERLVFSLHRNCLLVDGSAADTGEEQIVLGKEGRVLQITKRPSSQMKSSMSVYGESVGFLKLSRDACGMLRELLEEKVQAGVVTIEHEQVYPRLFEKVSVGFEKVDGFAWAEIDTPQDLERAQRLISHRV